MREVRLLLVKASPSVRLRLRWAAGPSSRSSLVWNPKQSCGKRHPRGSRFTGSLLLPQHSRHNRSRTADSKLLPQRRDRPLVQRSVSLNELGAGPGDDVIVHTDMARPDAKDGSSSVDQEGAGSSPAVGHSQMGWLTWLKGRAPEVRPNRHGPQASPTFF